jgi:cytochrome P450
VVVPADTRVILNVLAVHFHPDYYERPGDFRPERWLEQPRPDKFAYLAFGVGGRRCLGENMAEAALIGLLPLLGREWDFEAGRLRVSRGGRKQPSEKMAITVRALR